MQGFAVRATAVGSADDWLTVNVWRPRGSAAGLPVVVFIYGGAYMSGASSNPTYHGGRLAREGQLVVVTFDYRVGPEGFAAIEGAPLNRGLADQVAALTWVSQNVASFGGDPDRVTLVGQSAGAGSVACLLASPAAAHLFSRAVLHSVPGTVLSLSLARRVADDLWGDAVPQGRADLPEPAALAAHGDRVARSAQDHRADWGVLAATPSPWGPVVDGDLLPADPWHSLADGSSRDVPLLIGHTRDEYRLFRALAGRLDNPGDAEDEERLLTFAPPAGAEAFRRAYPDLGLGDAAELACSDWLFRMPTLALARAHLAAGGRTHLFEVSQPVTRPRLGAPHSSDVPLLFGNYRGGSARFPYEDEPSPQSEAVGDSLRAAWVRFAHGQEPGWPSLDADDEPTRIFGPGPDVVAYPERTSAELWGDTGVSTLDLPSGVAGA